MRYRHAWPGFLLLGCLALLLASLVIWGDHFLTPSPAGGIRRLLQLRLAPSLGLEVSRRDLLEPRAEAGAVSAAADLELSSPAADVLDQSPADAGAGGDGAASPARVPPVASHSRAVSHARYALELGTFAIDEDAERAEAELNRAGFSTVRFRQQAPSRLFTVAIRPLGEGGREQVVDQAKPDGFGQAAAPSGESGGSAWVAQALPLRAALTLAERLRSTGYDVHIVAEPARVGQITLRHGNFVSRQEAEAVSRELSKLGVPNKVVQLR